MDFLSGLQTLFGGDTPSSKNKGKAREESQHRLDWDLQKKNARLKEQLDEANAKILQLENQISSMKEESTKVENNLASRKDEMSQLVGGVNEQLHEMIQSLDEKKQQLDEIKSIMMTLQDQNISMEDIAGQTEELKTDIVEKIHSENVKCYRNMKSLVTDLEVKMEQMELGEESLTKIRKSFKALKFFSFFAFLDFIAIVFGVLYYLGFIPF